MKCLSFESNFASSEVNFVSITRRIALDFIMMSMKLARNNVNFE